MGDTEGIFLDILLPKAKPISVGITYRPSSDIRWNDVNFDNETFLVDDFNINLHNSKRVL